MKIKDFERLDINTGEIGKGDLFIGPEGQQVNLKNVQRPLGRHRHRAPTLSGTRETGNPGRHRHRI